MPTHTAAKRAANAAAANAAAAKKAAAKKKAAKKVAMGIRLKGTRNGDKKKRAKRTMA